LTSGLQFFKVAALFLTTAVVGSH